jgi:bromodomain adjacent to zinc finger domain protein 1A
VLKVYPPNSQTEHGFENGASSSATSTSAISPNDDIPVHTIGGDLKIPAKDAIAQDDPTRYLYSVQVTELEKERSHEKGKAAAKALVQAGESFTGSVVSIRCISMRYVLCSTH